MKKLVLLFACMILLFVGIPSKYTSLSRLALDGNYYLYIPNNPNPIEADMQSANDIFERQSKISAECIVTANTIENIEYLQNQLAFLKIKYENVEGRTILYAYSPKLKDSITVSGQKSNLQIVVFEDKLMIGYPIIYGGY